MKAYLVQQSEQGGHDVVLHHLLRDARIPDRRHIPENSERMGNDWWSAAERWHPMADLCAERAVWVVHRAYLSDLGDI